MPRIKKPAPPEHIVLVDTTILWHDDKSRVVNPDFDAFWDQYSGAFPMKLIIPDVVRGELLFQQTTSAFKHLDKANQEFQNIFRITKKEYSHHVTAERVAQQVEHRFDAWVAYRGGETKSVPIAEIDWKKVIDHSIQRVLPFTADPKNPLSEKGFRDCMILETVCSVCKYYSTDVNIAFLCGDYSLREAADKRLGEIESFTVYESIGDFTSFIELTRKNLTERFVKSILAKARAKFHPERHDPNCLIYKNNFFLELRAKFAAKIENPVADEPFAFLEVGKRVWRHIGEEKVWITRPQFQSLEGENIYHWNSKVTFVRMYERQQTAMAGLSLEGQKRLMVLSVDVLWRSKVRNDGRFLECEITEYKESESSFKIPTEEELQRWGLEKRIESAVSMTGGTAGTSDTGSTVASGERKE
jgi:PIN domain